LAFSFDKRRPEENNAILVFQLKWLGGDQRTSKMKTIDQNHESREQTPLAGSWAVLRWQLIARARHSARDGHSVASDQPISAM
jgi:hypothetical protein